MATIQTWLKLNQNIPYREKEWILQHILQKSRFQLHLSLEEKLNSKQLDQCSHITTLYQKGMPLAYILKETEFYGYKFQIEKGVFIPRPETEILVSQTLKCCSQKKPFYLIDMGCGSGCIGLSILLKNKLARLIAIDQSKKALDLTKKKCSFVRGQSSRKNIYTKTYQRFI